jgi:pilus assembly protein Flp/PilA
LNAWLEYPFNEWRKTSYEEPTSQPVAEAGLTEVCVAERTGQDLIEYGMVVAFIAFAATAGMNTLATDINGAFTTLGTDLTGAIA